MYFKPEFSSTMDGSNYLESSFAHESIGKPDLAEMNHPPGQWAFSSRIQKVALNPISKQVQYEVVT